MTLIDNLTERAAGLSRRNFLRASAIAGGGLMLSVSLPFAGRESEAATSGDFAPNAFIRIGGDGKVVLTMPYVEMGQGTYTSIPMLIAEELEVDLDQIRVLPAPPNDALYKQPLLQFQGTGGSTSIRGAWEPLRKAGATARTLLIAAAAQRWKVNATDCTVARGHVKHAASGREASYGQLVQDASRLKTPENVTLKKPEAFRLLGKNLQRVDTPAKTNGTALYGIDIMVPGMKFAAVANCPVLGGQLVRGVRKPQAGATRVMALYWYFLAVLAVVIYFTVYLSPYVM